MKQEEHSGWDQSNYDEESKLRFASQREVLNAAAKRAYNEAVEKYKTNPSKSNAPPKRPPKAKSEEFRFMHCWEVLQGTAAFMPVAVSPRKRKRSDESVAGIGMFAVDFRVPNSEVVFR